MKPKLNQKQRVLAAIIYLILLVLIFSLIGGNISKVIFGQSIDSSIWFYSGALLIVLGAYIAEPFFSKPSNIIINTVAVIVALLGLDDKSALLGYDFIIYYSVGLLLLSIISIVLADTENNTAVKFSKISYWTSTNLGHNKVIFSLLYVSSATTYFGLQNEIVPYILMITLWISLVFFDVIGYIITFFSKFKSLISDKVSEELGTAIGCENPLFYRVEIDKLKKSKNSSSIGDVVAIETEVNVGAIGVVVSKWQLLNKEWLSIYLLQNPTKDFLTISLKLKKQFADPKSIFTKKNSVYKLNVNHLSVKMQELIESTPLYKKRNDFIGYVDRDSTIEKINFTIIEGANGKAPTEGSIIETPIYDELTQYQIINANTRREHLENFDFKGFTNGIARKLGKYNIEEKELNVRKWLPNIFSPIYYSSTSEINVDDLRELAKTSIGRLPNSRFELPIKDYNSLVTHNTAIIGILGIGKSCLSYELIAKIVEQNIKVVCIDVTNEYNNEEKGLPKYIDTELILDGVEDINDNLDDIEDVTDAKEDGGNIGQLHDLLKTDIEDFIDSDNLVRIINPDEIIAIQQTENAKNRQKNGKWEMYAPFAELTVAEVTRVISEASLEVCKENGISETAQLLLVYEEAHSLIPEWNSVANDGDKYATNGTSKVILQGRKYGLGCFVITQRTANVSKSILNQCNTMFAMRVFDDTGKNFLENYFGRDYSDILPTLEERWAVTVGRGLKLKQPVIIELNNKDFVTLDE